MDRMMKYFWFAALMLTVAVSLWADEVKKDIPYYMPDFKKTGNVEYLQERCKLDVYMPEKDGVYPVVVYFHSGGLSSGSKNYVPQMLRNKPYVLVNVNYRLSGDRARCPDYIYDAAAAVAWTLKNIQNYKGDPAKVLVTGHSAGGYLAAMLALDEKYLKTFGAAPSDLRCVLPISGQMTTHFRILHERRQKDPATPQILIDEYAPIGVATGKPGPELILIVGDSQVEWPARVEENLLLAARLKRVHKRTNVRCAEMDTFTHSGVAVPAFALLNNYIFAMEKAAARKK